MGWFVNFIIIVTLKLKPTNCVSFISQT